MTERRRWFVTGWLLLVACLAYVRFGVRVAYAAPFPFNWLGVLFTAVGGYLAGRLAGVMVTEVIHPVFSKEKV